MTMGSKLEFLVNRQPIEVYNFLSSQQAIGDMKFEMVFPATYSMTFLIPNTAWKTGNYITVSIFDSGQGASIVRVSSENNKVTQVFDGGKNKKNCEAIQRLLFSVFR